MSHNTKSLEETINARIIAIGLLSMVLTALVLISAFHTRYQSTIQRNLVSYASMLQSSADAATLSGIDTGDYRVTLISADGTVLFDTLADARTQKNHAGRVEFIEAQKIGHGASIRRSDTLGYNTYYYALLLDSGSVLRISAEAVNATALFGDALPLVGFAALLIAVASVLLSMLLTKRLIRSVQITMLHPDGQNEAPYTELAPLAESVSQQRSLDRENERIRREFTANVSHELKTPLTSIRGYSEMIESGIARPEDVQIFARRIRDESERMVTLIRDIIALSELDEGNTSEAFATVDLSALANSAAELLAFSAEQRNVTIRVSAQPCIISGSKTLLQELVCNLCDNAIRYNRQGGSVAIDVHREGDSAVLTVSDTGIGIPPEHQGRIFERFYRVDKSRSRQTGGTGLGLAIVKHIASLHRATIHVASKPQEGTVMTVRFPCSAE